MNEYVLYVAAAVLPLSLYVWIAVGLPWPWTLVRDFRKRHQNNKNRRSR